MTEKSSGYRKLISQCLGIQERDQAYGFQKYEQRLMISPHVTTSVPLAPCRRIASNDLEALLGNEDPKILIPVADMPRRIGVCGREKVKALAGRSGRLDPAPWVLSLQTAMIADRMAAIVLGFNWARRCKYGARGLDAKDPELANGI